jgi:uncharacterized SAM-binding protein YcdF (DUF218 family)
MEVFLMPPLSLFALCAIGLVLRKRRPRVARGLVIGSVTALVLLCVPWIAAMLLRSLQSEDALDLGHLDGRAQAIVVLGGDVNPYAPEFGGPTVGPLSLERVRYAAVLARATSLPVLTSGGVTQKNAPPLSEMMKRVLEREYRVEVRWSERLSGNTRANAERSAEILKGAGIARVYLVTHAWHMPRAKAAFEAAGLEVVPAPTAFRAWPSLSFGSFLPSARSLRESQWALHEWIGRAWYACGGA